MICYRNFYIKRLYIWKKSDANQIFYYVSFLLRIYFCLQENANKSAYKREGTDSIKNQSDLKKTKTNNQLRQFCSTSFKFEKSFLKNLFFLLWFQGSSYFVFMFYEHTKYKIKRIQDKLQFRKKNILNFQKQLFTHFFNFEMYS